MIDRRVPAAMSAMRSVSSARSAEGGRARVQAGRFAGARASAFD